MSRLQQKHDRMSYKLVAIGTDKVRELNLLCAYGTFSHCERRCFRESLLFTSACIMGPITAPEGNNVVILGSTVSTKIAAISLRHKEWIITPGLIIQSKLCSYFLFANIIILLANEPLRSYQHRLCDALNLVCSLWDVTLLIFPDFPLIYSSTPVIVAFLEFARIGWRWCKFTAFPIQRYRQGPFSYSSVVLNSRLLSCVSRSMKLNALVGRHQGILEHDEYLSQQLLWPWCVSCSQIPILLQHNTE